MAKPMPVKDLVNGLEPYMHLAYSTGPETISFICSLREKDGDGALAFCSAKGEPGLAAVRHSGARFIICSDEVAAAASHAGCCKTLMAASDPRQAFALAARAMQPVGEDITVVAGAASISSAAILGTATSVARGAVIEDGCSIGAGCLIGTAAVLHRNTITGENCAIGSDAELGAPGFGFVRDLDGRLVRFPQLGRVVVGDDVEIGSRTTIDRGSLQDTTIGTGTKIDDFVYIAHNVSVGRDCLIMAGAILCGGCCIGDGVEISPGAVIRENVTVGSRAKVGLGAVVVKNVPPDEVVYGVPARAASHA